MTDPAFSEPSDGQDHDERGIIESERDRDEREITQVEDAVAAVESAISSLAEMTEAGAGEGDSANTTPEEIRAVVNQDRFPVSDNAPT